MPRELYIVAGMLGAVAVIGGWLDLCSGTERKGKPLTLWWSCYGVLCLVVLLFTIGAVQAWMTGAVHRSSSPGGPSDYIVGSSLEAIAKIVVAPACYVTLALLVLIGPASASGETRRQVRVFGGLFALVMAITTTVALVELSKANGQAREDYERANRRMLQLQAK